MCTLAEDLPARGAGLPYDSAMLSPSDFAAATDAVVRFIQSNGLAFERGDPQQYFANLTKVHVGLTLPIVAPERVPQLIRLKNLYALWNFVVDDEIDRAASTEGLDASMQLLLHHSRGQPELGLGSGAAKALEEIFTALPTEPSKAPMREMLYFDMWPLMTAFKYEYCINKLKGAANAFEYSMFAPLLGGISHYLDLDCLFATRELPLSTYGRLRDAYAHIGQAFKLSSDIGSLKRELLEEDNFNLVRLKAQEAGVSGLDRKLKGEEEFEALRPALQPFVEEVRKMANEHLSAANSVLATLPDIDSQRVLGTATKIVQSYFERDVFFKG